MADHTVVDHPAWLSQGAPQGESNRFVTFHYPLAFTILGQKADATPGVVVKTKVSNISPEDRVYMKKILGFVTERINSGKAQPQPLDHQPPPTGNLSTGGICDLCEMAHYTQWYAEFLAPFRFTILDCDSCEVPIAVLGEHRIDVNPEEVTFMEDALNMVAEQKYTGKFPKWMFDHNMRQIPNHYHFHVRPLLW